MIPIRTTEIELLRSRLRKHHFIAITGPEGSGKSKFCEDLCNSLDTEKADRGIFSEEFNGRAGSKWKIAYLHLNREKDPFQQLAAELAGPENDILVPFGEKVSPWYEGKVRKMLMREGGEGLIEVYNRNETGNQFNLLVVIDQFEELFVNKTINLEEQTLFIQTLLSASFEKQIIYVAIGFRLPKTSRWKHEFHELAEAIDACEYPLFEMSEAEISGLVTEFYREQSIAMQRRAGQSGNIQAHKISDDALENLVEELYESSNPIQQMQKVINHDFIRATNDGFETPMIEVVEVVEGASGAAGQEADSTLSEGPGHEIPDILKGLVQAAENTYGSLTLIQKRVVKKLFSLLAEPMHGSVTAPATVMTVDHAINKIGRYRSVVIEVIEEFVRNGILSSESEADLDENSAIRVADNRLFQYWDLLSRMTGMTPDGTTVESKESPLSQDPKIGQVRVAPPTTFGSDSEELAWKAENAFQGLNMLEKRVAQKVMPILAALRPDIDSGTPGKISLNELTEKIGKYKPMIPPVIEAFRDAGVIASVSPGSIEGASEFGITDYGIFPYWERFGGLASRVPKSQQPVKEKPELLPTEDEVDSGPREEIPFIESTPGELNKLVSSAESFYSALPMIKKRVAQKVLVIVTKLPEGPDNSPGFISVGDLITTVGRYDQIIVELVQELTKLHVFETKLTGHITLHSEIRLADYRLADEWERLNKWLYMLWVETPEKQETNPEPPQAKIETPPPPPVTETPALPPEPEQLSVKPPEMEDETVDDLMKKEGIQKRPKIVIKRKKPR